MLHAVIMAGGAGTRFWPESRRARPKQLLNMIGPRTMIQATVDRLGELAPPERVWVATTAALAEKIATQLPDLPGEAILVEPCKRDTAPCIGLAAVQIARRDPEAIMALMPSDHVIRPNESFQQAIRQAAALVEEDDARMVTFGIRPTYPAESFGYIERAAPLESNTVTGASPSYHVQKFHEKPDAQTAEKYLASGGFYWNSGIFVWKARTILDAIERFQPKMRERLDQIAKTIGTLDYAQALADQFAAIEPISIDLGVMEHASGVVVIEAPFEWDDVGSWRAIERLHDTDAQGNVVDAARHIGLDTTGSIIRCDREDHVVVTLGVDGLIVIVTPDATLVANKNNEESIRQVTQELEKRGWTECL
ncbi:MAG: NTP transferase domain-containing protein [Pirellulales bacterium]|nr:NTP transferase domain-containing protein [Pirellulales bacterium]